jgi:hypothetical protein
MHDAFEAYICRFAGLELRVERASGGWVGLVAASGCVPVRVTGELSDLAVACLLTCREAQRIKGVHNVDATRHLDLDDLTLWTRKSAS